jgi:type II secretory pathway pseudopilin PulG
MSDSTQSSSQNTIVIALVVVAVLLAALVGVLVYQQSQAAKLSQLDALVAQTPTDVQQAQDGAMSGLTGSQQAPPGMGGGAAATGEPVEFDAKTATKVPTGTTPEAFLEAYHAAVVAGKYDEAYKMLPLDKQKSYGDANSYASQVKGYGITGYKLGKVTENGDSASAVGLMENPAMPITYTWTFKKVGDTWFVESRTMGGTVE